MEVLFKVLPIVLIALLVVFILASGYVKASPDTAYIISGLSMYEKWNGVTPQISGTGNITPIVKATE